MRLTALPAKNLKGQTTVPGDKSISHRALLIGALARGATRIEGLLEGEDCLHTLKALQALGVSSKRLAPSVFEIEGRGSEGLCAPKEPLDCGNSGTTLRLLAGILAAQPFSSILMGDPSLSKRPMGRIMTPLLQMGAKIQGNQIGEEVYPPLHIRGSALQGITYTLPVASAQVKSCVLLAGLFAEGVTKVIEPLATRDHTEKMLINFGCSLLQEEACITLCPPSFLKAQSLLIPGDFSSAAFFIAGASFTPGSHLYLKNVGVNPKRTGLISILREMGAKIIFHHERLMQGEPIADIEVWGERLSGVEVYPASVASTIDEFPILFIACAAASGKSTIRGILELRYKESDRIKVVVKGLRNLGVKISESKGGVEIHGGPFSGGLVDSVGDHRVSMAFLMASLNAKGPIQVENCDKIATSFPGFQEIANQLGLSLTILGEK